MRVVDRGFVGWVLLGLAVPAALGWLITGLHRRAHRPAVGRPRARLPAAPRHLVDQLGLPLLRARRFATEDKSTNVWWLALPSFGEAWHHNHHAFPRSATHGLGRLSSTRRLP